ncbi:uncharacterized protein F5891DRAFT_600627 [Suillus fuscotomentosus]|uniref:Uncharacterized protein n=1 Tax=Suillus fuscotomentosus TaxID=1912939 RepID=A0AAD4HG47_9AGAM|nr:uncharacterized protein F5891DRAFT_600627 [Suillus fuscotomentosus]KAG1896370.1 hypothetical protein F5891DRAFT_600627 [Suillus fuscotomentosus]
MLYAVLYMAYRTLRRMFAPANAVGMILLGILDSTYVVHQWSGLSSPVRRSRRPVKLSICNMLLAYMWLIACSVVCLCRRMQLAPRLMGLSGILDSTCRFYILVCQWGSGSS